MRCICNSKHVFFHGHDKFGCEYNAGRIDMRGRSERALEKLLADETTFNHNLSYKCFKKNYGDARRSDRQFESEEVWEWKRRVLNEGTDRDLVCNPEGVEPTAACRHGYQSICHTCNIPICNECWRYVCRKQKILKGIGERQFSWLCASVSGRQPCHLVGSSHCRAALQWHGHVSH